MKIPLSKIRKFKKYYDLILKTENWNDISVTLYNGVYLLEPGELGSRFYFPSNDRELDHEIIHNNSFKDVLRKYIDDYKFIILKEELDR